VKISLILLLYRPVALETFTPVKGKPRKKGFLGLPPCGGFPNGINWVFSG
jgi:hypothetical protein